MRRLVCKTGLLCLLTVALLSACDDEPTPLPKYPPGPSPAANSPTSAPVQPTPSPAPTPEATTRPSPLPATPTPTEEPTGTPTVPPATPTPVEDAAPAVRDFDVDRDTIWRDLYDILADSEQSCIRTLLGGELELALERDVISMVRWGDETHLWDVAIFECLIPETAVDVFVAIVTRGVGELGNEGESCVRNLVAGVNVAELVAATLPDANPDGNAVVQSFSVGLLDCIVQDSQPQPLEDGSGGLSWRFEVGQHTTWSPIAMGGVLYVGSEVGEIHALDSETGRLLWSHAVGIRYYVPQAPTIAGGVFYYSVGGLNVELDAVGLYALDASTGARLWDFRTHSAGFRFQQVVSSPVVADGIVYFTSESRARGTAYLHALDAMTGVHLWEVEPEYHVGTPTIAGGVAYFAAGDIRSNHLHAVDALSRELIRRVRHELMEKHDDTYGQVKRIAGGVAYVSSGNLSILAVDASTLQLMWRAASAEGRGTVEPDWADEVVYVVDRGNQTSRPPPSPSGVTADILYETWNGYVAALDKATGELLWRFSEDGTEVYSATYIDGAIYVHWGPSVEGDRLYVLDPADGQVTEAHDLAKLQGAKAVGESTVVGRVLYHCGSDGHIYAWDVSTGELLWRHDVGQIAGSFRDPPSLAVMDGMVYVNTEDGYVQAVEVPE